MVEGVVWRSRGGRGWSLGGGRIWGEGGGGSCGLLGGFLGNIRQTCCQNFGCFISKSQDVLQFRLAWFLLHGK